MFSRQAGHGAPANEGGFTLVELLTAIALVSILVTLAAFEARQFWFVRSLEGGKDGMITTLRGIQQRVTSASNPLVYGARFRANSSVWELIEYNRVTGACSDIQVGGLESDQQFDAGVRVTDASFAPYIETSPPTAVVPPNTDITARCLGTGTSIAWFFARGSATGGRVTLTQPRLGRDETVCVAGLTGRVYERDGASC